MVLSIDQWTSCDCRRSPPYTLMVRGVSELAMAIHRPSARVEDRGQILNVLRSAFLKNSKPFVVCVTGGFGTGKTHLAATVVSETEMHFPGGIHRLYANPMQSLEESVALQLTRRPKEAYLVIIDEIEHRPAKALPIEVARLRRMHPTGRFLCLGAIDPGKAVFDLVLRMPPLTRREAEEILRARIPTKLSDKAEQELVRAIGASPAAVEMVAQILESGELNPRSLLTRLNSFSRSGLLGPNGEPISEGSPTEKRVIVDIQAVSDDVIRGLRADPRLLYELSPRRFEEIVADLLDRLGYDVTLTPASRDGGKDIYAAQKGDLGSFLYIVECKKYAPDHRVGVGLLRSLSGVVYSERATAGILATTSFFTKDAMEYRKQLQFQLSLKDYVGLQGWLENAVTKSRPVR